MNTMTQAQKELVELKVRERIEAGYKVGTFNDDFEAQKIAREVCRAFREDIVWSILRQEAAEHAYDYMKTFVKKSTYVPFAYGDI